MKRYKGAGWDDSWYFYKKKEGSGVWWVGTPNDVGYLMVSFDRIKIYNLFSDYPAKFSQEERAIFKKEEPYWANFFGGG